MYEPWGNYNIQCESSTGNKSFRDRKTSSDYLGTLFIMLSQDWYFHMEINELIWFSPRVMMKRHIFRTQHLSTKPRWNCGASVLSFPSIMFTGVHHHDQPIKALLKTHDLQKVLILSSVKTTVGSLPLLTFRSALSLCNILENTMSKFNRLSQWECISLEQAWGQEVEHNQW